MMMKSFSGGFGLVALAACLALPSIAHAQSGAGSNVIGELDAVGNVRVAQRDAPTQQVNVSNTRSAFFSGDGLATGSGSHAVLGLENESQFMFVENTGGAMGVVGQQVLGNVDFGTVCFAVPRSTVDMALTSGPYTFNARGAASGVVSAVGGRIELHVREGEVTVREAGRAANQRFFEANLSAGESIGLSVADVGSTISVGALADPCTPLGFGWLGPNVVPATVAAGAASNAVAGIAIVGVVVGAGVAAQSDSRRPDPVSP